MGYFGIQLIDDGNKVIERKQRIRDIGLYGRVHGFYVAGHWTVDTITIRDRV